MLRLALQICRKYNQDFILYTEKGDKPRYYTKQGKVDSIFSRKLIINDLNKFILVNLEIIKGLLWIFNQMMEIQEI